MVRVRFLFALAAAFGVLGVGLLSEPGPPESPFRRSNRWPTTVATLDVDIRKIRTLYETRWTACPNFRYRAEGLEYDNTLCTLESPYWTSEQEALNHRASLVLPRQLEIRYDPAKPGRMVSDGVDGFGRFHGPPPRPWSFGWVYLGAAVVCGAAGWVDLRRTRGAVTPRSA